MPKRKCDSDSQRGEDMQEENSTLEEINSLIDDAHRIIALANEDSQRKASIMDNLAARARPVESAVQSTVDGPTSAQMAPPTKELTAAQSKRRAMPQSSPNAAADLDIERINQYCRDVHRIFVSPNNASGRQVHPVRLPQTPEPLTDTVASLPAARHPTAVLLTSVRFPQTPDPLADTVPSLPAALHPTALLATTVRFPQTPDPLADTVASLPAALHPTALLATTVRFPQTPDPLTDTVAILPSAILRECPTIDLTTTPSNPGAEAIIDLTNNNSPLPQRRLNLNSSDEVVDLCSPIPNLTRRSDDPGNEGAAVGKEDSDKQKSLPQPEPEPKASVADNKTSLLTCPVCMESAVDRQPTSTKCGHVFCEECISQAIRLTHKCPICNKRLTKGMILRIYI